jgi:hypothetical protein
VTDTRSRACNRVLRPKRRIHAGGVKASPNRFRVYNGSDARCYDLRFSHNGAILPFFHWPWAMRVGAALQVVAAVLSLPAMLAFVPCSCPRVRGVTPARKAGSRAGGSSSSGRRVTTPGDLPEHAAGSGAACPWPLVKADGTVELDTRRHEVRANMWARRHGMVDEDATRIASADHVGRKNWTVLTEGRTYEFRRAEVGAQRRSCRSRGGARAQ